MKTVSDPKKSMLVAVCFTASIFLCFCKPSHPATLSEKSIETPELATRNIYRSPEERREAGLGTEITEWLKASVLVELETSRMNESFKESISDRDITDSSHSMQLGLDLTLADSFSAELVFEYEVDHETDQQHSKLDEGVIKYDGDYWDLELGRLFVPFGEYYSHFISGPMLEFGETSGKGFVVNFEASNLLDVFVFGLRGDMKRIDTRGNELDWGMGIEFNSSDESIKFGLGLISDLADADESILEDTNNVYERRVAGFNVFALFGKDHYEVTVEFIQAVREFSEFNEAANKPWAANLELAWFPRPTYQFALRFETSDELEDQPEHQFGLSTTWLIGGYINLAAEYLYGEFKNGFATDDDDNELDSNSQIAARISVKF